jgi:hypothetical protein
MAVLLLIAPWIGTVAPVGFVVRYTVLKQRWWGHTAGRTIVGTGLGVLVISAAALIRRWHGISADAGHWIDAVTWLYIGLVIAVQWLALEVRSSRLRRLRTAAAAREVHRSAAFQALNGQHEDAGEEDDAPL